MIGVESPRAACGDRSVAGPSASVVGAMASRGDTPSPADLIAFVRRIARQPARRLTTEEKRLAAVIRTVRDERVRSTETVPLMGLVSISNVCGAKMCVRRS